MKGWKQLRNFFNWLMDQQNVSLLASHFRFSRPISHANSSRHIISSVVWASRLIPQQATLFGPPRCRASRDQALAQHECSDTTVYSICDTILLRYRSTSKRRMNQPLRIQRIPQIPQISKAQNLYPSSLRTVGIIFSIIPLRKGVAVLVFAPNHFIVLCV